MKKSIFILFIILFIMNYSQMNAQIFKQVQKLITKNTNGFSEKDAADAIKEALTNGTNNSVNIVSKVDGYFKNPEIKIPFPKEAKTIETTLRSVGLEKQVNNVVLSINRAAEDAAKEAAPIFINAIKSMTITDAINIVKGDKNAATKYLDKNTNVELKIKFKPIIEVSLKKVNATKYWGQAMNSYNKIPLVNKTNPDLAEYVTDKAIEGLFIMIAKEELKIRQNPVARTSDLLKKVFGN